MRPPSYYASLSNYGYGNSIGASSSSNNSYNPTATASPLNRSSSSHQLRTNFSSPSSSSYVTRSHLPFVSQSMLVAHCFTGVSSSTKPNYGIQQRHQPTYSSGSSTYSTSYSRPKSLKRYQPSGGSYLSTTNTTTTATSNYKPSSAYRSYLTNSSTNYKPSAPNYYPKPIRLRERPLLTQISRQLNTTSSSRPTTTQPAGSVSHSERKPTVIHTNDSVTATATTNSETRTQNSGPDEKAEEESWSSDVARNISRNKYLIKFREFEKRPSQCPIQLTNRVEPETQEEIVAPNTKHLENNNKSTQPENHPASPEVGTVADSVPVQRQQQQFTRDESANEPQMKVPVDYVVRPSADQMPLECDLPKKIAARAPAKRSSLAAAELPAAAAAAAAANGSDDGETRPSDKVENCDQEGDEEKRKVVPKEKRQLKLKIRTSAASGASAQAPEPETKRKTKLLAQNSGSSQEQENTRTPPDESAQSGATSGDSPQSAASGKPKVRRLVKSSSKTVVKTPAPAAVASSLEQVKAPAASAAAEPAAVLPAKKAKEPPAEKQQISVVADKSERRKSTPKIEDDSRKVLAAKQEQAHVAEPTTPADNAKKVRSPEQPDRVPDCAAVKKQADDAASVQQNKRIRFRDYHLDDFDFLSVLGHGGWGFVILAELKEHDACFAVKCIKKITIVEDDDFDSIMIERKVLTLGNVHPFICKLFCTFETAGYLFFVMEYCAGGDLMFHVQKEGKFTESRCRFYAAEIICAIRFLHNRHIIYRDLKLDNILLDSRGHIRLVDFGMCQCRTYREEMLPSNFCGTPEYISPEIIKGVPYNHSVDWWSFGVLLYEMAVGKMPFRGNDENELLWNVCYEQIHYPMFLTKELTCLLQSLLEREPTKRMGMATCKAGDIYDQAWFRGVDWAAMEAMRVAPPFVPEVNSKRDVQNFDADFTESRPELSPVDDGTLQKIDQTQFQKFPYTNPDIFIFDSLC